jgi:hypothetical protein
LAWKLTNVYNEIVAKELLPKQYYYALREMNYLWNVDSLGIMLMYWLQIVLAIYKLNYI